MSSDNTLKTDDQEEKKWWTKTKIRILTLTSILILLGLIIEFPQKISDFLNFFSNNEQVTSHLRGLVTDKFGKPIEGAIVKILELPDDSVLTTSDGGFMFEEVPGKQGKSVRVFIFSKTHKPHNEYVTLPGPVKIKLND